MEMFINGLGFVAVVFMIGVAMITLMVATRIAMEWTDRYIEYKWRKKQ